MTAALLAFAAPLSVRAVDRMLLAIVCYPSVFYLADELGAPRAYPPAVAWGLLALVALPIGVGGLRAGRNGPALRAALFDANSIKSCLIVAIACLLVLAQYLSTYLLPDHDPIAVQAFAKVIARNHSALVPPFAPDDVFASYPPGFPILFSPVFLQFSGLDAAVLFKYANLGVVALTPLLWASYTRRIFESCVPGYLAILAWYVGFFCLDRTIGYTQPIAGKNAMLLAGFLFPFAFWLFCECRRSIPHFIAAALALAGLFLVHYSAIYMVTICALVYLAMHYGRPWKRPAPWLVHAASGVLALTLLLPLVLRLLAQPPEFSTRAAAPIGDALMSLLESAFSPFSRVVFIFHDRASVPPWPFKNVLLLLLCGWLVWIGRRFRRDAPVDRVLRMTRMFCVAWLLSLVLASGLVPHSGISGDYVRWFLFYFQAAMFAGGLQCFWIAWRSGQLRVRAPRVWIGIAISAATLVFALDYASQLSAIQKRRQLQPQLEQLDRLLAAYSEHGKCLIVAASRPVAQTGAHFIYGVNALNYVPVISDCRLVTGSWISRPLSGGRALGRLPDAESLARLAAENDVLYFGSDRQMRRYRPQVPGIRFTPVPGRVGPLSAWRVEGRAAASATHGAR